ncbi:efflux RND transporter periplasmic adaptor subunit [Vitreoscilla massiliensis]|uniref:Efflux RND transporter periplasmic adaptor subunit n=1 Tax=Vitreoscilla massiliensis TaxID=1689272 RepID=A0ABY4DZC1_9NEIS|nr:efflux RND transporter periplasmic adaptor subunit [Vitreoscilla massiliensis]UOO88870.1 efflux RND transporter periplasmic adaptor subunit [Vitreoscilla massiliensis]
MSSAHIHPDNSLTKRRFKTSLLALIIATSLAACGGGNDKAAAAGKAPPPPTVSVLTVQSSDVEITNELPGRLEASREAEVRARAAGIVLKRLFTEGSYVKAGQPLFQIDNAPYLANLETAKASLATAEANLAKANADVARYAPLVAEGAISKQEYDAAIAQQRLGRAQVQSAKAAIKTAQINVGYAYVTAPISGHIGKALVTEGALVGQGDVTKLAVIQQTSSLYVNLTQATGEIMKLRQAMANGNITLVDGQPEVTIVMEDGSEYEHKGRLLFTDVTVDETTGQMSLRAEVPNPDNLLLPGMYVRVKVPQAQIANATLVPQQAVTRSNQGDVVLIANADGSYAPRPVKIARSQGNYWVVTEGLKQGDKVIVDGMAVVGMTQAKKVQTKPWEDPNKAKAAPAAASNQAASAPAAKAASQPAAK